VKQQITDEVRNQVALENQEAQQNARQQDFEPGSSGIDRMLNDGHSHVFVVGAPLEVTDAATTECSLSDGDVLALSQGTPAAGGTVGLTVLGSKGGEECQKAATVTIAVADLQDMQNHMRETIDQGLQELQANQGKKGFPVAPVSTQTQSAQYAAIAPPDDPNVADEIQQQAQQAGEVENEVLNDIGQPPPRPIVALDQAPTVLPGQSINDVEVIMGQPTSRVTVGHSIVYSYSHMKVIFVDGKVSDVE
jgi:hypothetical protein